MPILENAMVVITVRAIYIFITSTLFFYFIGPRERERGRSEDALPASDRCCAHSLTDHHRLHPSVFQTHITYCPCDHPAMCMAFRFSGRLALRSWSIDRSIARCTSCTIQRLRIHRDAATEERARVGNTHPGQGTIGCKRAEQSRVEQSRSGQGFNSPRRTKQKQRRRRGRGRGRGRVRTQGRPSSPASGQTMGALCIRSELRNKDGAGADDDHPCETPMPPERPAHDSRAWVDGR